MLANKLFIVPVCSIDVASFQVLLVMNERQYYSVIHKGELALSEVVGLSATFPDCISTRVAHAFPEFYIVLLL